MINVLFNCLSIIARYVWFKKFLKSCKLIAELKASNGRHLPAPTRHFRPVVQLYTDIDKQSRMAGTSVHFRVDCDISSMVFVCANFHSWSFSEVSFICDRWQKRPKVPLKWSTVSANHSCSFNCKWLLCMEAAILKEPFQPPELFF